MSFIKKRKHGIYYYYWRDKHGKQRARSLGVSRKQQAQILKEELDLKHARKNLDLKIKNSINIKDYMKEYKNWSYQTKSNNWARREKSMINNWVRFLEDRHEKNLEDVDLQTIKDYYRARSVQVSAKTMSMEIGLMKRILKHASNDNYKTQKIKWSAINDIMNRRPEKHFDYFTRDQIDTIFESDLRYIDYYKVLFYTGLRSVDAGRLQKSQVKEYEHVIEIRHTKKTKAPAIIPIHPEIRFIENIATEYIFPDMLHDYDRRRARKDLQKFCKKQNWNGYYALHSFRHSFNQHLAMQNIDFNSRKSFLTHSSSKSTFDYTHFDIEKAREMIEKL